MKSNPKPAKAVQWGDFQTPPALAALAIAVVSRDGIQPASIVEPTCGEGSFLTAALRAFPLASRALGMDIDERYVETARSALADIRPAAHVDLRVGDFFSTDWSSILAALPDPILVVGNPPWVTNAAVGATGGANLPPKSNFLGFDGFEAISGKSNFDISEWMLIRLARWLADRTAGIAVLVKTAVARKVLLHCWKNLLPWPSASMHRIDAPRHFGAAVDACLLVMRTGNAHGAAECAVYDDLEAAEPAAKIGFREGKLIADVKAFDRRSGLLGKETYKWRSGVKHDCAPVLELELRDGCLFNGLGEAVDVEPDLIYPLLKGSDLANGRLQAPSRRLLLPQKAVGEETAPLAHSAPRAWRYLAKHADRFARRGSSIYRGQPRFAVFGLGDYTFALWKVAISALYKRLSFRAVAPVDGKPVVFDDTVYFIACAGEAEALLLASLLNSEEAADFFRAFVFWDAKRPITVDLLRRLDLRALAAALGREQELLEQQGRDASLADRRRLRDAALQQDLLL